MRCPDSCTDCLERFRHLPVSLESAPNSANNRAGFAIDTGTRVRDQLPVLSQLSNFCLFRKLKGVFNLNDKVPNSAFQLGVTQKQLHRPNVLGTTVNQRRLCPAHGVSAIGSRIQADLLNPGVKDTRVLSCAQMRRIMNSAREQIVIICQFCLLDPIGNSISRRRRNLKLHRL